MDDETREQVRALAAQGWSQRAIGERLGVSRGAVWRVLRNDRPAPGRSRSAVVAHAGSSASDRSEELSGAGLAGVIVLGVCLLVDLFRRLRNDDRERTVAAVGSASLLGSARQRVAAVPVTGTGPLRLACGHVLEERPFYLPTGARLRCQVCGQLVQAVGS